MAKIMTTELMKQIEMGVIPFDGDLWFAIDWYKDTINRLEFLGRRYDIVVDDLRGTLYTLESFRFHRSFKRDI